MIRQAKSWPPRPTQRFTMKSMRIALVSPYSWTYPGGVTRHIEALAEQFIAAGPRGARAGAATTLRAGSRRRCTAGRARSRCGARTTSSRSAARSASRPTARCRTCRSRRYGVATLHHELRTGGYDVVHIHEPVAPLTGWVAADWTRLPLVGTFHSYSRQAPAQRHRQPDRRPPGAQPPARADRRLRGGGLDRPALVRRPLPGDPQRRRTSIPSARRAAGRAPAWRGAADRVRRPGGPAQGAAAAAARVRGAARAHPVRADRDRALARGARAAAAGPARRDRCSARSTRQTKQRGARGGRRAVRAVAGRGELRHGADRGVRRRHAGGRLRHRRLPRRRARRRRRAARAGRRRSGAGRVAARPVRGARAAGADGRCGRRSTSSASPGRGWPSRCWRPTRTRSPPRRRLGAAPARGGAGRRPRRPTCARTSPARRLPSLEPARSPAPPQPGGRGCARRRTAGAGVARRASCWPGSRCRRSASGNIASALRQLQPDVGAAGPGGDVQRDGAARGLLARDPAGRAAARPHASSPTRCRGRSSAC